MLVRFLWFSSATLSVALGVGGCASKSSAVDCPITVPASCPDPSLSYDGGIGTVLTATCLPCHASGGVESSVPLTSYAQVSKRLPSVAGQLETCTMPPAGSPPLSAVDRQAILNWVVCSAPP